MNTFKNGDRVQHTVHGFARVVCVSIGKKLVEIAPDGYGESTVFVHPVSLTPVPKTGTLVPRKFEDGDRVSHPLHRDGTVAGYSEHSGLYLIHLPGNRAYYALGHQIEHAVPEPTYHICIEEITGAAHVPGSLTAKQVANYIEDKIDWRVVNEIKITKE
jgi:hypothetical protein